MFDTQPIHTPQDFADRRARVLERLRQENAALVLSSGHEVTRSNDTHYPFRPSSDFYYLTGISEPDATLILRPDQEDAFVLFVRPKDKMAEIWHGRRMGPQGAQAQFLADQAYPNPKFKKLLPKLLDGFEGVYLSLQSPTLLEARVRKACAQLNRGARHGQYAPQFWGDANALVAKERRIKDAAGIACLRRAVQLSAMGHRRAMQATRPGLYEHQLEAELHYEYRRHGSSGPGYGSIVAGGANATILHYVDNNAPLKEGQLVLIDSGAEWEFFSGDITRTFPVSGRFTPAQRDLYDIVLDANIQGIASCVVGGDQNEVHERCLRRLVEGLVDMGLCRGSVDEVIETKQYQDYYMHRTGHWLGLDVHDPAPSLVRGVPVTLAPDMVLTVEPGLYISENNEKAPQELRGTGIRIEDDIRVTPEGPENLSAGVPKSAAAIEDLMAANAE